MQQNIQQRFKRNLHLLLERGTLLLERGTLHSAAGRDRLQWGTSDSGQLALKFHRITQSWGLEGTSGDRPIQLLLRQRFPKVS